MTRVSRTNRWAWIVAGCALLLVQPPSLHADPGLQIWGTTGGGIQITPGDEADLPPLEDLVGDAENLRANWVESPGAATAQPLIDGITVTKVPEGWVPTVIATAAGAFQAGLSLGSDFINGLTHVNEEYCKDKGAQLAPQAPPFAGAPSLPRSQGPERAASSTDAATTNGETVGSDPVNPFNGELVVSETDLEFPGFGVPFRHTRTYRSRIEYPDSPMGASWTHSMDRRLVSHTEGPCAGVSYTNGDGTTIAFVESATIEHPLSSDVMEFETLYQSPPGIRATLRAKGTRYIQGGLAHIFLTAEWKMSTPDGTIATFDARGVMVRIEDLNQRGLTLKWSDNWAGDGYRLDEVVDSVGRVIKYAYYPDDHLKSVRHAASGLQASYSYTFETGDLKAATSSDGRTQHYGYDNSRPNAVADYVPEPQLRAACERVCGAQGSSCEATGVCDDIAAEAKAQCKVGCQTCIVDGSNACNEYCHRGEGAIACLGDPGVSGQDCDSACNDSCYENADTACKAFYEGKPLVPGEPPPSSSVSASCSVCEEDCQDHCGDDCLMVAACLVGAGVLAGSVPVAGAAVGVVCLNDGSGFFSGFEGLWDLVVLGALGTWTTLTCLAEKFCGIFGVDCGSCDSSNAAKAFADACNNSCQLCCGWGDNCAATSCQKERGCHEDCSDAFLGKPIPPTDNGYSCLNTSGAGGGGCPARFHDECRVQCGRQCSADCRGACETDCGAAVGEACGYENDQCGHDCDALDYVGLCREGCKEACVEDGRKGGAPRYGYARDLNHNLTTIVDGDLTPYLTNVYGDDPAKPSFDAVIAQVTGGRTLTFEYRDLEGEARGDMDAPLPGTALATYAKSQGRFLPVDICPTPCDAPSVFPTGEWVPLPLGLLLVDQAAAVGGLGSVGSVTSSAAIPPTLLTLTASAGSYRATSVTGMAGLPTGLGFKLTLPSGDAITFTPRSGGAWDLTGTASVLASFVSAHKEVTIVRDAGATVRAYPGRPRSMAHLVAGTCTTPFRAERNDAGQLQMSPPSACKGDLIVSPMATVVSDAAILAKFASGNAELLDATDAFGGSPLVPGRYVARWIRVPEFPGRYESALGPEEGGAPSTLTTMAFATVQAMPLLRAPSPPSTLADGRPLFAFHLPQTLRPTSTTTTGPTSIPAWDLGDKFDVPTRDACLKTGMPGPASRGPTSAGPLPATASVVTDPYGAIWTFYYDAHGNTLRQVNHGTGATRSFNYDAVGDLIGVEHPLGDRMCMRYDTNGNLVTSFQFPVPGAIGDGLPIRHRWSYKAWPARPEQVFDPRDPTKALATYVWDDRGRLWSITDATGTSTMIVPTDFGLPGEIHAPDGTLQLIDYDESVGLPRQITADATGPSPVVRTMEHDAAGRPVEATSPLGDRATWTWTGGALTELASTADGRSTATMFEVDDGRVKVMGHGLRMTDMSYDLLGLPRRTRTRALDGSADTRVSCTQYGPGGRLLEEIRPDGSRVKYDYDGEGRLTAVTGGAWPRLASDGFDAECAVASPGAGEFVSATLSATTYDVNGRPTLITDAAGDSTTIQYDGFGRIAMITDARGASHRSGYDAMGHIVWSASYASGSTAYHVPAYGETGLLAAKTVAYDEVGRVQRIEVWQFDAAGAPIGSGKAITTYAYQPTLGRLLITDPVGAQTVQTFDGAGRLVLTQFPTFDTEAITYLDGGRTILREWSAPTADGMLTERARLTAWGAPSSIETDETGSLQVLGAWSYDADRRPIGTSSPTGSTQETEYDAFGQAVTVETAIDAQPMQIVTVKYDAMGRVVTHTSDAGNGRGAVATNFAYDVLGRVRTASFPGGRTEGFTYKQGSSLVVKRTDPRGVEFGYAYTAGALDAITAVPPGDAAGTLKQRLTFTRDLLGRPLTAKHTGASFTSTADDVVTTFAYDSMGNKLREWHSGLGSTLGVTHIPDARGQARWSSLAGTALERVFDPLGRLTDVKLTGDTTSTVRFTFDGLGGPTQRLLSSGVTTTYGYDPLGRLETLTDVRGSTVLAAWRWEQGLDGVPRLAALRKNGAAEVASVYQVDPTGRVLAERNGITGLASTTTLAPGAPFAVSNETVSGLLAASETIQYVYDGRDNWKQRTSAAAPALNVAPVVDDKDAYVSFGPLVATYDARGALKTLGSESYGYDALGNLTSADNATQKREYAYDAFGRRVYERDGVTGAITRYGYDGLARTIRKAADGQVDVTIDDGLDEHLVRVTAGGGRQFYHQERGRSVYLVTGSAGQPLEWYEYGAYGEMSIRGPGGNAITASTIGNRYGFQGQPFDLGLGLVDMRARQYRPGWGRFISPDPLGHAAGPNLYAFVGGATLSFWDPLGLAAAALARTAHDFMNRMSEAALANRIDMENSTEYQVFSAFEDMMENADERQQKFGLAVAKGVGDRAVQTGRFVQSIYTDGEYAQSVINGGVWAAAEILDQGVPDVNDLIAAAPGAIDTVQTCLLQCDPEAVPGTVGHALGGVAFDVGLGEFLVFATPRIAALWAEFTAVGAEAGGIPVAVTRVRHVLLDEHLALVNGAGDKMPVPTPELPQGGSYAQVRGSYVGGEVNHIPADSVSPLSHGKGPAILMETDDHYLTASWGSSAEAEYWREMQAELIAAGRFDVAVEMDISNIKQLFGSKYDGAIRQMLNYIEHLRETGQLPGRKP